MKEVYVHTDAFGDERLVGRATLIDETQGLEALQPGLFTYAPDYLAGGGASIEPDHFSTALTDHSYQSKGGLPGALMDAGPDDWGKRVMAELRQPPEDAIDMLLLSRGTGVGALRVSLSRDRCKPREEPLNHGEMMVALGSARQLERREKLSENALRALAAAMSFGGARPKVSVRHAGADWIAKFPSTRDAVNQPRVEYASLRLAAAAGITVPDVHIEMADDQDILLVRRFDIADDGTRRPFLSMASALIHDGRTSELHAKRDHSYPGMAGWLSRFGAEPATDRPELFRRACFHLCLGHVDDHIHNHAFLQAEPHDSGWRLAPDYDVAPSNGEALALAKAPTVQAIGLGAEGRQRSLGNLFSRIDQYGLDHDAAVDIYTGVVRVVRDWRDAFSAAGVTDNDIERMAHRVLADDIGWDDVPLASRVRARKHTRPSLI